MSKRTEPVFPSLPNTQVWGINLRDYAAVHIMGHLLAALPTDRMGKRVSLHIDSAAEDAVYAANRLVAHLVSAEVREIELRKMRTVSPEQEGK